MDIYVCIGSSCHLKGSYNIINAFKALIAENHLEDKVNLSASFCLGHCQDGVSIRVGEEIVTGLNTGNVKDVFAEKVLKALGEQAQ